MECLVCQIPDPGNHYSESCCRPCAAFFRRTIKLKLRYKCVRFGDCPVVKDTRYKCRYCRMKRCIEVGMTYAENPNALLEYHLDGPILPAIRESDHDFFTYERCFHKKGDFGNKLIKRLERILQNKNANNKPKFSFPLTLCQQAMIAYEEYEKRYSKYEISEVENAPVFDCAEVILGEWRATPQITEFCMEIQDFAELPLGEKSLLLQSFLHRCITLDRVYTFVQFLGANPNDTRVFYHNGKAMDCMHLAMVNASALAEGQEEVYVDIYRSMNELLCKYFHTPFKRLNPDRFEFVYLLLMTLFRENIDGISRETQKVCEKIRAQLADELQSYYQFQKKTENYACRIYNLHNILVCIDRVGQMLREEIRIVKTLDIAEIDEKMYDLVL